MADPRRNGSRLRRLRRQVAASEDVCHICGLPIDPSLKAPHPMSASMDHLVPVSRGGSVYSRENLRAAHRICNTRRGNRPLDAARRSPDGGGISAARPGGPLPTSREW